MEKKKLLLVAISVGIFLVITIGAAILIFTPKNITPPSSALTMRPVSGTATQGTEETGNANNAAPDPVDLVRNNSEVPGLKPYPEGAIPEESDYYVGGSGTRTVITVPKPSTAAVPDAPPAGRAVSAPPVQATPVPVSVKPAPQPVVAKPAVQQTKVYNDFWVQTGAFSTIARAEGVKEALSSKGITSIIENREVDGTPLFRVRVGPYTSQNEANFWLSLIKSINGFEDSQVRQTQSRR